MFIYRGVSSAIHEASAGRVQAKSVQQFEYMFHIGEQGLTFGMGAHLGSSDSNAVIRHQLNQAGFPTRGISTTIHFDRARFYALGGGKHKSGVVYEITTAELGKHGVRTFRVADYTPYPSVPEDDEVILVSSEADGALPPAVITSVRTITAA